jgi:serine/threonine-protein kinase
MVGDKALAYFASLDPRELTDSALARHVKTLTQIAGVRMEQARYPEAQQAYRSAYARAAELASRNPKDGQVLFVRGQAEWGNSFVHWKRGEIAAATEWFVRYRDTTAALVALEPGNRSYRVEFISNGHNFAALATENGQFALARERFLDTRAALEALLAENPNDLEVRYQLADVTSWLGTIAERTGALTDAVRIFGDQAAQLEAIVDADPTMLQWRFKLSDALSFQAEVLAVIGRVADAQQTLARARELMEPLVARDDANRRWRHGLLVLHLKQAMLAKATGDAESARQSAALARDGYEQLVAAEPSNRAFSFRLAMALRVQSELLAASGNAEPAVALRAVTLGEKLIGQGRALSADVGECAQACIAAGRIAIAHGESEKALQLWRRAGELLAPRLREAADWRILDPAARVATLLGQRAEAADIVAQLTRIGYVPLEPWPDSADVFFTETPIKPPK